MRRFLRYFVVLFLIVLFALSVSFANQYNYNVYSPESFSSQGSFDENKERIIFIVDYSNSMNERIKGITKIDMALNTISSILPKIPQSTYVGLRAYGYRTGFTPLDSCLASKLIVAPMQNSASYIEDELHSLQAKGTTPITHSLKQCVKNDFGDFQGTKRIILLTDGGENCDESPCNYAIELMKSRNDFKIDVIALDIWDKEANAQLRCTALATNGKFYSANTSAELLNSFSDSLKIEKEVSGVIVK